ncbi:TetR/AcrR family transcriptional regulator [Rhodococcus wratislaviensis]|uniref:TetR/AcrR family transcriptional regulator n=1 Tax=Rhodococcus wratislaviensis TaxID=44752 RepID=UPI000F574310|nr:TetR/AcrR family transcriptional regulator [Rhodococcus wratislaviensis]
MATRPTMEPLQNRSRQSAVRILRAAIDVITDLGIQDFTMAAVATRAEVSVGGVYGRYPDKDALLYAVKDQALSDLANEIGQRLAEAEGTVEAVVDAYVTTLTRTLFGAERLYAFIFVHSADDERLRSRGFAFHQQIRSALVECLKALGVDDERAIATTYEIIVQSLLMRVISLGHLAPNSLPYEGFPSPDDYASSLVDYTSRILRAVTD